MIANPRNDEPSSTKQAGKHDALVCDQERSAYMAANRAAVTPIWMSAGYGDACDVHHSLEILPMVCGVGHSLDAVTRNRMRSQNQYHWRRAMKGSIIFVAILMASTVALLASARVPPPSSRSAPLGA